VDGENLDKGHFRLPAMFVHNTAKSSIKRVRFLAVSGLKLQDVSPGRESDRWHFWRGGGPEGNWRFYDAALETSRLETSPSQLLYLLVARGVVRKLC